MQCRIEKLPSFFLLIWIFLKESPKKKLNLLSLPTIPSEFDLDLLSRKSDLWTVRYKRRNKCRSFGTCTDEPININKMAKPRQFLTINWGLITDRKSNAETLISFELNSFHTSGFERIPYNMWRYWIDDIIASITCWIRHNSTKMKSIE